MQSIRVPISDDPGMAPSGASQLSMPTEPFLRDVSWMRSLRRQHVERVVNAAYVTVHETDAYVATAGSEAVSWLGVESGLLKISGGLRCGKVVMFTGVPAGGWVGEGSVIKRERRRYDVIAMRRTRVLHVPAPTFMWLLQVNNEFARFVIDHLNERLAQYIGMVETDRVKDLDVRLARGLLSLFNPIL